MVKPIKRRKPQGGGSHKPHKPRDLGEAARICMNLPLGEAAGFTDGSQIQHGIDGVFHAYPPHRCQAAAVLPHIEALQVEAISATLHDIQRKMSALMEEHTPESRDDSGRFPIYSYSRLAAEECEEESVESGAGGEGGESPEPSEGVELWAPNLGQVKALHLCGTFMVWELDGRLVLDDDGSNSAVHVFTDKSLALSVMRGRTRRRGLHAREGYVGSVKHSGNWRERVERLLG